MTDKKKKIKGKVILDTGFFTISALKSPGKSNQPPHYLLNTSDYVCIIAVLPDGRIPLVKQYRPAIGGYTLELPSGHIDGKESPVTAANRELLEETGILATRTKLMCVMTPDTGRLTNQCWCCVSKKAKVVRPDSEHGIETILVTPKELLQMVKQGKIAHALHVAPILMYLFLLKQKKTVRQRDYIKKPVSSS